ncbi:MAG: hypothetical protein IK074_01230 [Bacteroidales bacterium]|nr:hypothetical protein [Bacteroidales bacterium]
MKRLIILLSLALLALGAQAQNSKLIVRNFTKSDIGDMRARTSPVFDNNKKLAALIDITFAASDATLVFEGAVGEPVQYPGEWLIHVPEGTTRIKISMEDAKPVEFNIPVAIESGMVYLMDLDIEEAVKMRTLILPTISTGFAKPVHLSYGVMVGFCKVNGGYFRVKTDFSFGLKTVADTDAEGMIEGVKGWYTGETKKSRFAVTGGYMRHLTDLGDNGSLYAYVGGGYGTRTLAWQMYGSDGDYQYAKVVPSSFSGIEAETGVVVRLGGVVLSAGAQTNSFKFWEANIGVGVMF